MKITDNREAGETPLEQAKLVMIKMLKTFHNICEQHQLTYWIDAGTLLGAVRHNGFIPWDDDIDICMPREDYEIFIHIANKTLPKDILLQYKENSLKKWRWIKLRDKYSTFIQESELKKDIKYHQGIFIDIFPYDLIEKDFSTTKLFLNRRFKEQNKKINNNISFLLDIISIAPIKLLGYEYFKSKFIKQYSSKNFKYVSTGIEVTAGYKTFKRETLFPLRKIKFEDEYFYAPNDYDTYLTTTYGDYMKLPKPEDRIPHAAEIKPFTPCNHEDILHWNKIKEEV
ncbi:MAG: LicD family protein [Marinifilaceae bacterium]